jgi:hypothetical protein
MTCETIDAPISAICPSGLGYVADIDITEGNVTIDLGPLVDESGQVRGPTLTWYAGGATLDLVPGICVFHDWWVSNGVLKYELWLYDGNAWEWHSGDWSVGHGNLWDFGLWHTVMTESGAPERLPALEMEPALE